MAQPFANVTRTYTDGIQNNSLIPSVDREIHLFSPSESPFGSALKSVKANQRKEEWLEDELDKVGENAQVEGFDVVREPRKGPERYENVTQIFYKQVNISGTADVVQMYSRRSDLERQTGIATKSLVNDIEFAYLNGVLSNSVDGSTPRKMRGAFEWAHPDADITVPGEFTPAAQLTEEILLDCVQAVWDNGVAADTIQASMSQRRKISAFTQDGRLTVNQDANEKKVTMAVDVIRTEMGTIAVVSNRFIQPMNASGVLVDISTDKALYDRILVYKRDVFVRRPLRPVNREELAKIGDSKAYFMVAEHTLQCRSRKGVGKIEGLSRTKAP